LLAAVVKANAYGHGSAEISSLAPRAGADWLAVEFVDEGVFLRESGLQCPILLLGNVQLSDLQKVVENDLRLTVFNVETLERLAKAAARVRRDVRVHLKVETGMNRRGMLLKLLPEALDLIGRSRHIQLEGLCSHLATADEPDDPAHARSQLENFHRAVAEVESRGIRPPIKHLLNSAGTFLLGEARFDMVRMGISTYGLWPSEQTRRACMEETIGPQKLDPVMAWKTKVVQVKEIKAGSFVGYGRTFQTTRATKVAALPVGYSDGYDRKLSNRGHVLIREKRAPILGRVSMNVTMVDVTDIPGVRLEDEVVLLGRQGDQEISADELASLLETINYEVVTRVNWAIPRVVIGGDAV
jgi:alanine racemase